MATVIETRKLSKKYLRDEFHVVALKDVDLEIHSGEFVALMGPSGSGKTTLLHLIAAMDFPSSGEIRVLGEDLRRLSDREMAHWRNENVGFVFQSFNLIPVLTAQENVELPLKLTNLSKQERREHAVTALNLVGLGERLNREFSKTIIMVTHDPRAAQHATLTRHLEKGELLPVNGQPSS